MNTESIMQIHRHLLCSQQAASFISFNSSGALLGAAEKKEKKKKEKRKKRIGIII